MTQIKFAVEGMTCGGCASRLTSALQRDARIASAVIDFATKSGVVEGQISRADVSAIVSSIGYKVADEILDEGLAQQKNKAALTRDLWRMILAVILGVPVIALAMGPWHNSNGPTIQAVLTSIFLLGPANGFFIRTVKQLRHGFVTMDALVSIGMASAWVLSMVLMRTSVHHLYFESAVMIGLFVMLGKSIEDYARKRSIGEIDKLVKLRPRYVWKVENQGIPKERLISEARVGDVIYLRPGDMLPLDGVVIEGRGSFDESVITGESIPVIRQTGDEVPSGAINSSSIGVHIRVSRIGKDTTVEQIIRLIEDAKMTRPAIQRLADKISGMFVPVVIALALATLVAGHYVFGLEWESAFLRSMSVLVVACPCALGLATPVAWVAGLGRAANAGVLVRNYDSLDALRKSNAIIFDKTGTLTIGKPKVKEVLIANDSTKTQSMRLAFSALSHTSHPLARAVADWIKHNFTIEDAPLSKLVEERAGEGVTCEVRQPEYYKIIFGRPDFVVPERHSPWLRFERSGNPLVAVSINNSPELIFELEDALRDDAAASIMKLRQRGFEVYIASGDKQEVVDVLAAGMKGINSARGRMTPKTKQQFVVELQNKGKMVAFVGDGINDAPALAAANVGIALGSGTDVAAHSSGLVLQRLGTRSLLDAIDLSHRITRIIRENFFWAFFYNVAAIPVAMLGLITPMWAAAAMALSSVTVVLNALRLRL